MPPLKGMQPQRQVKGGQSQRFKPISIYGNDVHRAEEPSFFHYRVSSGAAVAPAEVDSSGIILGECPRQVFLEGESMNYY